MKYWILKTKQAFNAPFEKWIRAGRKHRWFSKYVAKDVAPEDRLIIWESAPARRVIAIGHVISARFSRGFYSRTSMSVRFESGLLKTSLTLLKLKELPLFKGAKFLEPGPPRTMYTLSQRQGDYLFRNVRAQGVESLYRGNGITKIDLKPETDPKKLAEKVRRLRSIPAKRKPSGNRKPNKTIREVVTYERDPAVKAWVLSNSNGYCELCDNPAPFTDADGFPFLEVHHIKPLGEDGPDVVENAIALCPNCHRRCHHAKDRKKLTQSLFGKVKRLQARTTST